MRILSILLIILLLLAQTSKGQQPKYTAKHFVKSKDTSEFKSIVPNPDGFVRTYLVTNTQIWDLDDDSTTYVMGGTIALVCFEGQQINKQNEGIITAYLIDSMDHSKRFKIYEQTFQNGKLNGQWRTYSLRGSLVNYQTFKNDSLNGITRNFWIDGKTIMSEVEYFNGRNKYIKRGFHDNGKLKSEIPVENELLNGVGTKYYEDGNIEQIVVFKDGQFDGPNKYYYPNGQLWSEIVYKNGKCWEAVANYEKNGKKRDAGTLHHGNGTIIYYNEDGTVREIIKYLDGFEVK